MLVNISSFGNPVYNLCHSSKIHLPVDRLDRLRICGLYADLKLYQPRTQGIQKFQFLLRDQIGGDLKMEIRHTIIMLCNKFPDFHRMIFLAVEGTIHKFDLRHLLLHEKGEFLFDQIQIPEAEPLVNRGKTVAARKWTAAARLIINDAVLKFFQIRVWEIHFGQIHDRTPWVAFNRSVCITVCNTMDLR